MKIWRGSDGHIARNTPVGDIYVNDSGDCFIRQHTDVTQTATMWRGVSAQWAKEEIQRAVDQLTEHEKYYLVQSLGLDPETEL